MPGGCSIEPVCTQNKHKPILTATARFWFGVSESTYFRVAMLLLIEWLVLMLLLFQPAAAGPFTDGYNYIIVLLSCCC